MKFKTSCLHPSELEKMRRIGGIFMKQNTGFPPHSFTCGLTWRPQGAWAHIPLLLNLNPLLPPKSLLLIPHEPLPLSSVQIGPFLQSLNRSAGFCQRNFPCCILTRCKQLMMNTAWLLLDLLKASLAMYPPQPLLAPAVCFHFSAGNVHPHRLPNATLPGSQLGRAALFSII